MTQQTLFSDLSEPQPLPEEKKSRIIKVCDTYDQVTTYIREQQEKNPKILLEFKKPEGYNKFIIREVLA